MTSFADNEELFTHDAIMDLCPWFISMDTRSADLCEYSYHELAYVLGLDPPRYPVPAVQDRVIPISDASGSALEKVIFNACFSKRQIPF